MKPKGGDGMNEKMEQIRRAVKAGKLTADGARKALEDEMERELSQKPEDIDMDVVNACEALLTELSGADEALHTEENRAVIRPPNAQDGKRAARPAYAQSCCRRRGAGGSACLWRHGDGAGAFGQRSHQTA